MEITLYQHQRLFLEKNPNKYLLAWAPRLGKTLAAIRWANENALVICPRFLVAQWQEQFSNALIIGKEQFRITHKQLPRHKTIIIDECHTIAGNTSQVSKALYWYIKHHDPEQILLLSGTPYTSSPWCVWQYGLYLGRWEKDRWLEFRNAFFREQYFGIRSVWVPKDTKETKEKLVAIMKSFGETIAVEDVFELEKDITIPVHFSETKKQKKLKDENEDIHPLARLTALHQIEQNASDKDDWLKDIILKNKKVIVVCRYNDQLYRFKGLFPNALVLNGDVKDKKAVIDEAERAKECVLLVNIAIGTGYGLPSFPILVFASMDFSYINFVQMFARNKGPEQLQKTATYVLITKDGIDEDVWDCVQKKKDFTTAIYERTRSLL